MCINIINIYIYFTETTQDIGFYHRNRATGECSEIKKAVLNSYDSDDHKIV